MQTVYESLGLHNKRFMLKKSSYFIDTPLLKHDKMLGEYQIADGDALELVVLSTKQPEIKKLPTPSKYYLTFWEVWGGGIIKRLYLFFTLLSFLIFSEIEMQWKRINWKIFTSLKSTDKLKENIRVRQENFWDLNSK